MTHVLLQRQEVPGAVTPPEDTHNGELMYEYFSCLFYSFLAGVPLSASKSLEKEPEEKEPGILVYVIFHSDNLII